jgi:hypothetical protein
MFRRNILPQFSGLKNFLCSVRRHIDSSVDISGSENILSPYEGLQKFFWVMTSCRLVGRTNCLHLQGIEVVAMTPCTLVGRDINVSEKHASSAGLKTEYISAIRWYQPTILHCCITQNIVVRI